MTNDKEPTAEESVTIEFNKARQHELERALFDALRHYYTEVRKFDDEAKMYDPDGKAAFVVVAFNNVKDEALLLDGKVSDIELTAEDRAVAISYSSIAVMPYVTPNEDKQIGPPETIQHGVQAVACAMLLSSIQADAVFQTMAMAQQVIIRKRGMQ